MELLKKSSKELNRKHDREIRLYVEQKQDLQRQLKDSAERLKTSEAEMKKLRRDYDQKLNDLNQDYAGLKRQSEEDLERYQQQNDVLKQKLEDVQLRIKDQTAIFDQQNKALEALMQEKQAYQSQEKKLLAKLATLSQDQKTSQSSFHQQKSKIEKLVLDNDKYLRLNSQLQEKLKVVSAEIMDKEKRVEQQKNQLISLKDEHQQYRQQSYQLKEQLDNLRKAFKQKEISLTQRNQELKELSDEQTQTQKGAQKLSKENKELKAKVNRMESRYRQQLMASEQKAKELESELKKQQIQYAQQRESYLSIKSSQAEIYKELNEVKSRVKNLGQDKLQRDKEQRKLLDVKDKEMKNLSMLISEQNRELKDVEASLNAYKKENLRLVGEIEKISKNLTKHQQNASIYKTQSEKKEMKIIEFEETIKKIADRLREAESSRVNIEQQLSQTLKNKAQVEKALVSFKTDLKVSEAKAGRLETELFESKDSLSQKEQELANVINDFKRIVKQKDNEILGLNREIKDLKVEIAKISEYQTQYAQMIKVHKAESEKSLADMSAKEQNHQQIVAALNQRLAQKESDKKELMEALEQQKRQFVNETVRIKKEITAQNEENIIQLNQQIKELISAKGDLQDKVNSISKVAESYRQETEDLFAKNQRYRNQVEEVNRLNDQIEKLISEKQKLEKTWSAQEARLLEQLAQSMNNFQGAQLKLSETQIVKSQLEESVQQLTADAQLNQQKISQLAKKLEDSQISYEESLNSLRLKLQLSDKALTDTKHVKESLESTSIELRQQVEAYDQKMKDLQRLLERKDFDYTDQLDKARKDLDSVQEQLGRVSAEKQQLEIARSSLKDELKERDRQLSRIQQDLQMTQRALKEQLKRMQAYRLIMWI